MATQDDPGMDIVREIAEVMRGARELVGTTDPAVQVAYFERKARLFRRMAAHPAWGTDVEASIDLALRAERDADDWRRKLDRAVAARERAEKGT